MSGGVLRSSGPGLWLALVSLVFACSSSQLVRGQTHGARRAPAPRAAARAKSPALAAAAVAPSIALEPPSPTPEPAPTLDPFFDPSGQVLQAFHAALLRAQAGAGQARIVFYGASHVASDLFTGIIRQRLQRRFGEAGPGFVVPGKPWRYYRHAGITMEESRGLRAFRIRARAPEAGIYGLAGVALDARPGKPALAAIATRPNGGLTGNVSRAELYYLKQPNGGRLTLFVDGVRAQRVNTRADRFETGYATVEVPDGAHRFELRTGGEGPVRFFGLSLEREAPGVILDTLGIPGTRARDHLFWDDAVYREHLARRRPDLLVLAYGTNESGDDDVPVSAYEDKLRRVLTRAREVASGASCLLIGPSDRPLRNEEDGSFSDRPLTTQVIAVQRRVAAEFGCAFYDMQAFMGGPMSMLSWVAAVPPLASTDYVHLTALGYERLADSLHEALLRGLPPALPPPDPPEPEPAPELVASPGTERHAP